MNGSFEQAKAYFLKGLDQFQADRLQEAEASFGVALNLAPGRLSTLINLGAVKLKLGKPNEALELLEQARSQQGDSLEALGHGAQALAELGRPGEALGWLEQALALDARQAPVWSLRGQLLRELGRVQEAITAFEEAVRHGADEEIHLYYIASLGGAAIPPASPGRYVETLFDSYAEQFDGHMQALNYRAPQRLVGGLQRMDRRFARALDLGCGTGICGVLLRPLVEQLDGVDMSSKMVAKAKDLGIYQTVIRGDLLSYLHETDHRYDLVLAADVFIYVGLLEPVFAAVAAVTDEGAVFCFSVESGDEVQDLALQPSMRYVHSEAYLRRLAAQYGFSWIAEQHDAVREDQGQPIPGLYVWLRKN